MPSVAGLGWSQQPESGGADASDIETIDLLHRTLQRDIEICVADETHLDDFIERLYKSDDDRRG